MTAKNIQACLIDRFGLPEAQRLGAHGPVGLLPCVEDKTPYAPPEYDGCKVEFSCNGRTVLVILDDREMKREQERSPADDDESPYGVTRISQRCLIDLTKQNRPHPEAYGPESENPLKDIIDE